MPHVHLRTLVPVASGTLFTRTQYNPKICHFGVSEALEWLVWDCGDAIQSFSYMSTCVWEAMCRRSFQTSESCTASEGEDWGLIVGEREQCRRE
jgi:hypothetical protein